MEKGLTWGLNVEACHVLNTMVSLDEFHSSSQCIVPGRLALVLSMVLVYRASRGWVGMGHSSALGVLGVGPSVSWVF